MVLKMDDYVIYCNMTDNWLLMKWLKM